MSKVKREKRTRMKIVYVSDRPRLSVHRSNKYVYAQVIDQNGKTILGIGEKDLGKKESTKVASAKSLGIAVAKKTLDKKIKNIVFDKGRFAYHGRVKAVADGAREGGLEF